MVGFVRVAPAGLRVDSTDVEGALCSVVRAEPDSFLTNRVTGLGAAGDITPAALDRIAAFFGDARYMVAGDVPGIESRGFSRASDAAVFTRGVERYRPPATELVVRAAGAEDRAAFGEVCGAASGTPRWLAPWFGAIAGATGWHCFLAFDGEKPVATGALFAAIDGGWLGFGATLPSHRRRGAQSALLAARIRRAAELGLSCIVAGSGADSAGPSFRNLERAGFRLVSVEPVWFSPNR